VGDFGSVVAAGAAGRDATLNEVGRAVGSVVAVGATETVCVLHAGVPGCLTGFSLVRRVWVKNDCNVLTCSVPPDESSECPAPADVFMPRTPLTRGRW